jgi:hypothetical protein
MTILRISEVPAPISYNLALNIWLVNSSGNSYVPGALNLFKSGAEETTMVLNLLSKQS